MSVQFGRWSFDGEPPEPGYLEKAAGMLAPYGPDGGSAYSAPGIDILCVPIARHSRATVTALRSWARSQAFKNGY